MCCERNKLLVRSFMETVVNTGDVGKIEKYISPDYTEIQDDKKYPIGLQGAKEHILDVRQTYPDLKLTIGRQIAEGEWVATCITARGTHKGLWMGIRPTGKLMTYTGVNINRICNGLMVEHGGAVNLFGPLLEVGAIRLVGVNEESAPD